MSNHHLLQAQKLLGIGLPDPDFQQPDVPPGNVALAQVHALLQIADHMGDISAELTMLRELLASQE